MLSGEPCLESDFIKVEQVTESLYFVCDSLHIQNKPLGFLPRNPYSNYHKSSFFQYFTCEVSPYSFLFLLESSDDSKSTTEKKYLNSFSLMDNLSRPSDQFYFD